MISRATRPALKAGAAATTRYASEQLQPELPINLILNPRSFGMMDLRVYTDNEVYRPVAANAANYATLREIEGRLKSIRNIEKITKTMKIVASTKLTRAQRAMTESRNYGHTSNTVFEKAETKAMPEEGKKSLIIVASSDK
ncbi:MAG: hypothetical protein Q9211_000673, partial [Gyalolechia sp. 1 TL-2023]